MKIGLKTILIAACAVFWGCDTESSLEPRFEDYFIKYFGGNGDQTGVDFQIIDDGFVLTGNSISSSISRSQIFLVRTDLIGNEVWSKEYGGLNDEQVSAVEVDPAGNIYLSITVQNDGGDTDVKILKVNSEDGAPIDSIVVGDPNFDEVATDLLLVNNGDVILSGYTTNVDTLKPGFNSATDLQDVFSIRATANLDTLDQSRWRRIYGFPGIDRGVEIIQQPDGTFLFFGTTDRPPNANAEQDGLNMFLFPTGDDGVATSVVELLLFGTQSDEAGVQIAPTFGGGYVLLGTSTDGPGVSQGYVARILSNSSLVEAGPIRTDGLFMATSVTEDLSGGFLILGNDLEGTNSDIYLVKRSLSGDIVWQRSFGGIDADVSGRVRQLSDGSIVIIGTIQLESQTKLALIKTNPIGQLRP